jgi:hypothetical protein
MWITTEARMNGHAAAGGGPAASSSGKAMKEPIR